MEGWFELDILLLCLRHVECPGMVFPCTLYSCKTSWEHPSKKDKGQVAQMLRRASCGEESSGCVHAVTMDGGLRLKESSSRRKSKWWCLARKLRNQKVNLCGHVLAHSWSKLDSIELWCIFGVSVIFGEIYVRTRFFCRIVYSSQQPCQIFMVPWSNLNSVRFQRMAFCTEEHTNCLQLNRYL